MKTKLDMVKDFRRTFGLPVSDQPVVPEVNQRELHTNMIRNEAWEILEASTHIDIRDVIADLHYFVLGLASEAGVTQEQLDSDFAAVHAANMAKLWTTAEMMKVFPADGDGVVNNNCTWTAPGGWEAKPANGVHWVVTLNGKVQKPPGWKAAVLEGGAV